MSNQHRAIPVLPQRPRVHCMADHVFRSYPVGRQSFSCVCKGRVLALTITTKPLPTNIRARLMTTMDSVAGDPWTRVPFVRSDRQTLVWWTDSTTIPEDFGSFQQCGTSSAASLQNALL